MAITGTGTEADPWILHDSSDLSAFAASSSYWASGTFAQLGSDIDMTGVSWSTSIAEGTGNKYLGTFDGCNHTISHLDYTTAPLFYLIAGTVRNIIMDSCSCTATSSTTKCFSPFSVFISGSSSQLATVTNCHIKNSSHTSLYEAQNGYFAYSLYYTAISNCTVENCTSNTNGMFSGISPSVEYSTVTNCSIISCNFTSDYQRDNTYSQACLVSKATDSTITGCTCTDTTFTSTWGGACICGGLMGTTTVSNCSVTNCVINSTTSPIVGIACGATATGASITNVHVKSCRATSTQSSVGGLVSYPNCTISKCSVRDCYLSGYYDSGAFTSGSSGGSISDCYCDNCTLVSTVPSESQYFTYCSGGFIYSVGGNITISNCYASNITHTANSFVKCGGFVGDARSSATITDCCCYGGNYGDTFAGVSESSTVMTNCKTSADISESDYHTQSWWQDTMEFDFDDTWVWNIVAGLPRFTSGGSLSKLYLKLFGTWVTMGTDE